MSEIWLPYKEDGIIPKDYYRAELIKSERHFDNEVIILHGERYLVRLDAGKNYYRIYDRELLFNNKLFCQKEVIYWSANDFEEVIYSISDGNLLPYLKEIGNGAWLYDNSQKHLIVIATNIIIELVETEFITIHIKERSDN